MKRPEVLAEMARKMRKRTAKQRDCQISAIRRRVITEYWQSVRKPMSQEINLRNCASSDKMAAR